MWDFSNATYLCDNMDLFQINYCRSEPFLGYRPIEKTSNFFSPPSNIKHNIPSLN